MIEKHFALQLTQARHLTENSTLVQKRSCDLLGTQFKQGDQCVYFVMYDPEDEVELHHIIHTLNVKSFPAFEATYDYVRQSNMVLTASSLPMFASKIPVVDLQSVLKKAS